MSPLQLEIERLQRQLIDIAEQNQYSLTHPSLLAASQELDVLILEEMMNRLAIPAPLASCV